MKDYMILPIEIKSIHKEIENGNEYAFVEGYASIYNNIDLGRDRVMPGYFKEDLERRGNKRPALFQHSANTPVGANFYTDSTHGLKFLAKLPLKDTFVTGRLLPQLEVGSIQGASIGYTNQEENYNQELNCNDLIKGKIHESSFVVFPMNTEAVIISVRKQIDSILKGESKSQDNRFLLDFAKDLNIDINTKNEININFVDYPLLDEGVKWDKKKSINQIKENTNSNESPSKNYGKGFLFSDSEKSNDFTGFKLPYVYYDNGFKAVPGALFAIAGALSGEKGYKDMPLECREKIKEQLNKYYKKMGHEEPFKKGGKTFIDVTTLECMEKRDLEKIFDDNIILSTQAKELITNSFIKSDDNEVVEGSDFLTDLKSLKNKIDQL